MKEIFNKKNKILIISFLLGLFLIYHFAIKRTIEIHQELKYVSAQLDDSKENHLLVDKLIRKEKQLDSLLLDLPTAKNTQRKLLEFLSEFSEDRHVAIVEFHHPHSAITNKITTISYEIILQGKYKSLETLLYYLEKKHLGKISHIELFSTQKHQQRNKLYMRLIIQNY